MWCAQGRDEAGVEGDVDGGEDIIGEITKASSVVAGRVSGGDGRREVGHDGRDLGGGCVSGCGYFARETRQGEVKMMSSRERAARPEVTRSELAQLVRWMLDSGLYDTEDVVDAIVKPNWAASCFLVVIGHTSRPDGPR